MPATGGETVELHGPQVRHGSKLLGNGRTNCPKVTSPYNYTFSGSSELVVKRTKLRIVALRCAAHVFGKHWSYSRKPRLLSDYCSEVMALRRSIWGGSAVCKDIHERELTWNPSKMHKYHGGISSMVYWREEFDFFLVIFSSEGHVMVTSFSLSVFRSGW
jgi:hypothetical protein